MPSESTGKRLNVYFTSEDDIELYRRIEAEAKRQKRSISQMIKILAANAILQEETSTT